MTRFLECSKYRDTRPNNYNLHEINLPEKISGYMSIQTMSEFISRKMSEHESEQVPGCITDKGSEKMSECMSDKVLDRMPESVTWWALLEAKF